MSSSSDSDTDDELLAEMSLPKIKHLSTPPKRRLIDIDDNDYLLRLNLKAPKITKPPSFLNIKDIKIWKDAKQLAEIHKKDQENAQFILKEDDEVTEKLKKNLCEEALQDHEFVNFVLLKHKDIRLEDFYVVGVPLFIEPKDGEYLYEVASFPTFGNKSLIGDFFNVVNYRILERMELKFDESVEEFSKYIGFNKKYIEITGKNQFKKITESDFQYDPCVRLQDFDLILLRISKYIQYLSTLRFNLTKWESLVRMIGILMIDKRFHSNGSNRQISSIVQDLFKWSYDHNRELMIKEVIEIWDSVTDLTYLKFRILEKIEFSFSEVINQLKIQLHLHLLANGKITGIQYIKSNKKLNKMINSTILNELNKIITDDNLSLAIKEDSNQSKLYFQDLAIKLRCILNILKKGPNFKKDKYNSSLKEMMKIFLRLQTKIIVSYEKADQTNVKSLLMMLISVLHHDTKPNEF